MRHVKRGTPAKQVYEAYERKLARIRESGYADRNKEMKPFDFGEVFMLMAELHPVKRPKALEITKQLIEVLCERKAVVAKDLYEEFGWNDRTLLKRLNILAKYGLVRREAKKYYLATPRLFLFKEKYMAEYIDKYLPAVTV